MSKLSPKAEMLAQSFSETFWELVGWERFCEGCNAPGAHDPEQGCPAGDDPFSSQCYRNAEAESYEDSIREFATSLCKTAGY